MAKYQLYGLDRSGAVVFSQAFDEASVEIAKARAKAYAADHHSIELWAGTALIYRSGSHRGMGSATR